jgi:hypothetical protein
MKRLLILVALVALALPAAALAKGPSEASLKGPGLGKTVKFTGSESDSKSSLMQLADAAGFFPAVFAQQPDPMLPGRPKGDLGPKYTIDYTVPGEYNWDTAENDTFSIKQDAYPYAEPYGITYTAPGQKIYDMTTRGGWFTAPRLRETLNVPATAPTVASSAGFFSAGRLGVALAFGLLLCAAVWFYARRRPAQSVAA